MTHDAINNWIENAKQHEGHFIAGVSAKSKRPQVIKRVETDMNGNLIMEVADKIRPWIAKMFEGVRDDNGLPLQPAHVRGIALNVAQSIVKEEKQNASA